MNSSRDNLKPGSFYWVLVQPLLRRDRYIVEDVSKKPEWQPAKFVGVSGDSDARLVWEVLGEQRDEAHHHADVVDFGPEIMRPERGCL